jgi:hypothetical protein
MLRGTLERIRADEINMSIEETAEKLFQMSNEVWERHANPWSVWTRYPCLPLLCFAVWSRVWIDWLCLVPVVAVCLWIWVNPRVFGRPHSTNSWASKAVLGERVLLTHPKSEIPAHHTVALRAIKYVMSVGFIMTVYGLIVLHLWLAIFGTVISILGKTWFLDRMVWLYQDLCSENSEYQSWLY